MIQAHSAETTQPCAQQITSVTAETNNHTVPEVLLVTHNDLPGDDGLVREHVLAAA